MDGIISIKKGRDAYPSPPLSFLPQIPLFLMEYNNAWLYLPSLTCVRYFFPAGAKKRKKIEMIFLFKSLDGHTLTHMHTYLS